MNNNHLCTIFLRRRALAARFVTIALIFYVVIVSVIPALAESGAEPYAITLSDSGITTNSPGVYAEGSVLTITLPGEYKLTGSLSNGQIVVDCEQDGKVKLHFQGISVHCENAPALYIKKCSPRLSIELVDGTENELSDGADYTDKQSNANAVIFSKSDLTITGTGSLKVKGSYRNGIVSKDDLRIKGGKISVEAVHNGITGKDSVEIFDGEITVRAGNDGIRTTNDDPQWGYILMEGGAVTITCGDEPLKVIHGLSIIGGTVNTIVDASMKPAEN